jgi:hypothetical protein
LLMPLLFSACRPNQRIIESGRENPPLDRTNSNIAPAARSFESDIDSMRTADFYNIYVFRRKDGGQLDADDKAFLAANLPGEVNRRMLSDDGKALIAGSNFQLPDGVWTTLKGRFSFEDFSAPVNDGSQNANRRALN